MPLPDARPGDSSPHPASGPVSGPASVPVSDPLPDGSVAMAPEGSGETPRAAARTPDDYLETPGAHRRDDGAATDVGA